MNTKVEKVPVIGSGLIIVGQGVAVGG